MQFWLYLRLIILTAGTLLPLFWMVVILGHRRRRNFERVFFFLCLSLLLFFGSSLLALNGRLYYASPQFGLARFCQAMLCVGLLFFPSLLVHLHVEYAEIRGLLKSSTKRIWSLLAYLPLVVLTPKLYLSFTVSAQFDWAVPSRSLGIVFQLWIVSALAIATGWQWRFYRAAPDREQRVFHRTLAADLFLLTVLVASLHLARSSSQTDVIGGALGALALIPLGALIRNVQRFNFLQIGRQRNLIYAVFVAFVALLYLSFVRRVSTWTEAYLPPEATAAILLFLPVFFFEPLQRLMRKLLQATAKAEMDRAQRLMGPILERARLGYVEGLRLFAEHWIGEQLQLAEVRLSLSEGLSLSPSTQHGATEAFSIRRGDQEIGTLFVRTHGAMFSGETYAALQFLCEQLPGAIDLCRLIEEKLRLERELAERERLALVGQMAASISHNLKNPLGSMKTILQLQLENPAMPESLRAETRMVLDEVGRLSAKLNQLLQFSRPAVRGGEAPSQCDSWVVAEQVVSVLRPEAERRGVRLELASRNGLGGSRVNLSSEALHDVLSNLIVNAVEVGVRGGHVEVRAASKDGVVEWAVEDDGPGIPESSREKILQPFFTTKSQGTGLGLAIVARRIAEAGGELRWHSPVRNGRGTRFEVLFKAEKGSAG